VTPRERLIEAMMHADPGDGPMRWYENMLDAVLDELEESVNDIAFEAFNRYKDNREARQYSMSLNLFDFVSVLRGDSA